MPGITGLSAAGAADRLAGMERKLYPASGLRRQAGAAGDAFACAVHARRPGAGVIERGEPHGACLAFDGYVVDEDAPRGPALLVWLLDGFLARGPAFLERLDGSFQAAVHQRGTTWLFADPTASRRLFYAADERGLFFCAEVAPLAGLGRLRPGERIDRANLVQFLVSGRFFAGQTLLPWVRQLLPGETVGWRAGRLERRRHFLYQVAPVDGRDPADLREELGDLLERAVLRAWDQAEDPVLVLSGGYDSRTIFHAVARRAGDSRRLRTALWGQRMDEPGSDSATAREVARRAGVRHSTLPWRTGLLPEQFDEMFRAQSGMTELVFTHSDELAVFRRLAESGFRSALRGDECFGPRGEEVLSVPGALARVSMGRAADVPESARWLLGVGPGDAGGTGDAGWFAAHDAALSSVLAEAPATPSELRDTLYGRERLPAYLHHHNYHKLHFLEMVNPLLDAEVLRFWSTLPRGHRLDKALVKDSYHARYGDHREVPIASKDNGPDWAGGLRESPALAAWVREGLASLPEPLNGSFFLAKLDAVLRGDAEPAAPAGAHRVPALKLVARAVVLGRWLRTWAA